MCLNLCLLGITPKGIFFNDDQDIGIVVQNMYSAIFLWPMEY